MTSRIIFENKRFYSLSDQNTFNFPKFDSSKKCYYTDSPIEAAKFRKFADVKAKQVINALTIITDLPLPASIDSISDPWVDGSTPMPHQITATKFILQRNRSYAALDAGLGKTACAAMASRLLSMPTIYSCPPFLLKNVKREYLNVAGTETHILGENDFNFTNNLIVPDSMIDNKDVRGFLHYLLGLRKTFMVIDEAHRFKSPDAKRTKALFSTKDDGLLSRYNFSKLTYLSGTPMPNRPMELYPVLRHSAWDSIDYMNFPMYGKKYCGGFFNGFGMDYSGTSNEKELARRVMSKFMLRMHKRLVLKDLPKKTESIFILNSELGGELARLDYSLRTRIKSVEDVIKASIAIEAGKTEDNLHLTTYRRLLGVKKVKPACEYIKSILDETNDDILLFYIHKEVSLEIAKHLKDYVEVSGSTPVNKRQDLVDEFMNNKLKRIFVGQIDACGIGYNLTKANRVMILEAKWEPGGNSQAGDRADRIGQQREVHIEYLVCEGTIDESILRSNIKKLYSMRYL